MAIYAAEAWSGNYVLSQPWDKLEAFMLDGCLEIDNNRSERSIKPFVIGHWLFSNTYRGALFEQLPNIDTQDPDSIDRLLPWSTKLAPSL
jgi:transposase